MTHSNGVCYLMYQNSNCLFPSFMTYPCLIITQEVAEQPLLMSSWICKVEGTPNWRTEQMQLPGCPEENIAYSRHRDNLTSSASGGTASALQLCLRLPPPCSSTFGASAAQSGTVRRGLRRSPLLLPPVPAILERPAIGGNRCQLLGKSVV